MAIAIVAGPSRFSGGYGSHLSVGSVRRGLEFELLAREFCYVAASGVGRVIVCGSRMCAIRVAMMKGLMIRFALRVGRTERLVRVGAVRQVSLSANETGSRPQNLHNV